MKFFNWLKSLFKKKTKPQVEVKRELSWRDKVLKVAINELGIKEIAGREHHPRIIEYHAACNSKFSEDEIAWCSAFMNWVMRECEYPRTLNAVAQSWKKWGVSSLRDPQEGDVVVFKRPKSWRGHVGIYIEETKDAILVLGGNQSNSVCYKWYPKKSSTLELYDIRKLK